MDAAADYAAARHALAQPLPAYVSYVLHSQGSFGPFKHADTQHVVVRTSDGKIVSGKLSSVQVNADTSYSDDLVTHPPFKPACYDATSAKSVEFQGNAVEELSLAFKCRDSEHEHGFTVLYVDPATHEPIAALEERNDSNVYVRLEQRFARVGTRVLPSGLDVRVKGSGFLGWLDVTAHQVYSHFALSDSLPSAASAASPSP